MPAAEKDVLLAVSVSFLLVLLALASSSLITPEWPHAHIKMHINIIRTQLLTVILAQLLIYIYIYYFVCLFIRFQYGAYGVLHSPRYTRQIKLPSWWTVGSLLFRHAS